jgi:hypothetical protein
MESGIDFLKSQVNNAVAQHAALLDSLTSHASQARDARFRDLCRRFIPIMTRHQGMLEEYQASLGATEGKAKKILGRVFELGKDLVDAMRESDYYRLVGDLVMSRQAEDTFKTFREAGRMLGNEDLRRLGDEGERDHDRFAEQANRLVQEMFVEQVRAEVPSHA